MRPCKLSLITAFVAIALLATSCGEESAGDIAPADATSTTSSTTTTTSAPPTTTTTEPADPPQRLQVVYDGEYLATGTVPWRGGFLWFGYGRVVHDAALARIAIDPDNAAHLPAQVVSTLQGETRRAAIELLEDDVELYNLLAEAVQDDLRRFIPSDPTNDVRTQEFARFSADGETWEAVPVDLPASRMNPWRVWGSGDTVVIATADGYFGSEPWGNVTVHVSNDLVEWHSTMVWDDREHVDADRRGNASPNWPAVDSAGRWLVAMEVSTWHESNTDHRGSLVTVMGDADGAVSAAASLPSAEPRSAIATQAGWLLLTNPRLDDHEAELAAVSLWHTADGLEWVGRPLPTADQHWTIAMLDGGVLLTGEIDEVPTYWIGTPDGSAFEQVTPPWLESQRVVRWHHDAGRVAYVVDVPPDLVFEPWSVELEVDGALMTYSVDEQGGVEVVVTRDGVVVGRDEGRVFEWNWATEGQHYIIRSGDGTVVLRLPLQRVEEEIVVHEPVFAEVGGTDELTLFTTADGRSWESRPLPPADDPWLLSLFVSGDLVSAAGEGWAEVFDFGAG